MVTTDGAKGAWRNDGESEGRMRVDRVGAVRVEKSMAESQTCSQGSARTRASQTPEPGQHRAAPVSWACPSDSTHVVGGTDEASVSVEVGAGDGAVAQSEELPAEGLEADIVLQVPHANVL